MSMNLKPLVSVLMPVYNCAEYISDAVESILVQTFRDFELIIIDDCSTDETKAIIQSYDDPRIRLVEKPRNSGYTDSLNAGIVMAEGTYIARMDGDDIAEKDRLRVQYEFLEKNREIGVCGSWYSIIGSGERIVVPTEADDIKIAALEYNPIAHPTVFLRRSLFTDYKFAYNRDCEPAEDYDLWCRMFPFTKVVNIPANLLRYRRHSDQVSVVKSEKQQTISSSIRLMLLHRVDPDFNVDLEKVTFKKWSLANLLQFADLQNFLKKTVELTKKNKLTGEFTAGKFDEYIAGKQIEAIRIYLSLQKKSFFGTEKFQLFFDFIRYRNLYLFRSKKLVRLLISK
jgi:glycosyltransferase involved in cell wall biosynthesis